MANEGMAGDDSSAAEDVTWLEGASEAGGLGVAVRRGGWRSRVSWDE